MIRALRIPILGLALLAVSGGSGAVADDEASVPLAIAAPDTAADATAPATEDSLERLRRRAVLEPDEPYWPYRLALHYGANDTLAAAEEALHTALARDSAYAPALALLSRQWFETGRHREAIALLEALRTDTTRFPSGLPAALLEGLALHYDAVDRLDRSTAVLAELRARGEAPTRTTAVYLTLRGNAPEAAAGPAAEALKIDPEHAVNHNNYGITKLRAGEIEAAREAFLAAVEIEPRLPGPYYNLAILEKFYAFDDAAGARWLARYRERSRLDPDGIFESPSAARAGEANERTD